jgi:hypothetical protein
LPARAKGFLKFYVFYQMPQVIFHHRTLVCNRPDFALYLTP